MLNLKEALASDLAAGVAAASQARAWPQAGPQLKAEAVPVERPEREGMGDLASPVALKLARSLRRPALEVAAAIAEHMPKREYVGRVTVAAPGYINIRLNPGWMTARLDDVLEADVCAGGPGPGKRVNLEYISANPTGPLTLGNVRAAFSADTLANVLACAGFEVTREYYFNDAGQQVRTLGESVLRRMLQASGHRVDFPETLYQGEYVAAVAREVAEYFAENEGRVFTPKDLTDSTAVAAVTEQAVGILKAQIQRAVAEDLHISFDVWTSEAQLRTSGKVAAALERLKERGVIYEKEGAVYLRTTQFGDADDRVLVKSDGEYAYIMPDVAYHAGKYERGYDVILTFVGADHQGHVPKLRAAVQALGYEVDKLHVVAAQWLRLVRQGKPVRLSKRAGAVVEPKDLIAEVGYDAARFFMVQHALNTHMDFDLDLAQERSERNPVYYVQYAYVRLQSILRQAKERGAIAEVGEQVQLPERPALTHTLELALMRQLYRFPEVVADVARSLAVHELAYYAMELARAVHVFYRHVPVLTAEPDLRQSRLQLVLASRTVLGRTLDLLGIGKPEVM